MFCVIFFSLIYKGEKKLLFSLICKGNIALNAKLQGPFLMGAGSEKIFWKNLFQKYSYPLNIGKKIVPPKFGKYFLENMFCEKSNYF